MGIWTSVQTACIQMLRRPGYLIALLLCPVVILAGLMLMPEEDRQAEVLVGVAFAREDETTQALWESLEKQNGDLVTFCRADPEEIERKVAAGQWECGFLFPEDLSGRMDDGDWEELVTLVATESSLLYRPVAEQVTAALLEQGWDEIGEGYLEELGIPGEITAPLREVLPEEDWVAIEILSVGGSAVSGETKDVIPYESLLTGIVGLWLFMAALLAGGELHGWLRSPYARYSLPGTGLWGLLLPKWVVLSLAGLIAGLGGLLLAGASGRAVLGLGLYVPVLSLLSLWLALLPVTEKGLPVLLPVVPLASAVLSPLLVDVSRMVPALEPVSCCLPLTGYLRFVRGEGAGLLLVQLAGIGSALLIFSFLWKRKEARAGEAIKGERSGCVL